jgi:tetratricopeptide (TPR) repeat protein
VALHLLIAVLLFGPSPAPNTSLEAGDLEFQNLRYANALALYDTALTTSDDSASVLWRMARSWICLADTSESDDQLSRYQRAESCAIRAVRADSSSSQAHAWLAAAIGNVAMFKGARRRSNSPAP